MNILLPNNIKSEFYGYNYLASLMQNLKDCSNTIIIFDFKNVRFFEANLCAIFGAVFEYLENNNNTITLSNIDSRILNILRKNEFLLPYGYTKAYDSYDTTLVYKKFSPYSDKEFNKYIQEQLLNKVDFPSHSKMLGKKITENIFELYENARTHGQCEYIHICGQFFPNKTNKPLHFTIVDKGINIKENVSIFFNRDIKAKYAIYWAMQMGNTTKTGSNPGGLGLAVIFEFIKKNRGKIQVISSDGFYEFANGNVITKELDYCFEGTMVNIAFNLNDSNHYKLVEEDSFENIF
ncbi:hypothetical protein QE422_000482 [Chryseobacterium sp. SORGH_AS 447]|uniref:ATP-binding protein n=1 Tax=Chryseobacterium sp. SORGH_AS_0447 TaxID=3041769 RepID=UPI002782D574|nr:ATP-binding protein [Chryseobacterium sp. SORGH_AS_0447]MDQ1160114.1 hypothetical protein [Chryseobacterium sp. SORGH_AS_0447]